MTTLGRETDRVLVRMALAPDVPTWRIRREIANNMTRRGLIKRYGAGFEITDEGLRLAAELVAQGA